MFLKECASACVCLSCRRVAFESVEVVDSVGVAGMRGSKFVWSGEVVGLGRFVRTEGE
jgi:hypothetical protein